MLIFEKLEIAVVVVVLVVDVVTVVVAATLTEFAVACVRLDKTRSGQFVIMKELTS